MARKALPPVVVPSRRRINVPTTEAQAQIDTRALEIATAAATSQVAHDKQDESIHTQMITRLDRQDDDAEKRTDKQNDAREALREELIGYLTKLSERQWKGLIAVVGLLISVLASVLLKDKIGL